jgi:hypothetical protein
MTGRRIRTLVIGTALIAAAAPQPIYAVHNGALSTQVEEQQEEIATLLDRLQHIETGPDPNLLELIYVIRRLARAYADVADYANVIPLLNRLTLLHETAEPTPGAAGVSVLPVTDQHATDLDLGQLMGALIGSIVADGPAADSDLEPGDVVLNFDARPIADVDDLVRNIFTTRPGTVVQLDIINRNGLPATIPFTVGERNVTLDLADDLSLLGWVYRSTGADVEAIPPLTRAVALYDANLGGAAPGDVVWAVRHLGNALYNTGGVAQVIPYLQRRLALYEGRFSDGVSTAEAVRNASLEMLKNRREESKSTHPFFWAPFVAVGASQ